MQHYGQARRSPSSSKERVRPPGIATVAIYTKDGDSQLHMRLTLPEEKIQEHGYKLHSIVEHDGEARMRLTFEWLETASIARLRFVFDRRPAGQRQPGNALRLDVSERYYVYDISVPELLTGCSPASATTIEIIDYQAEYIDFMIPEELMPYEHRFLETQRTMAASGGQVPGTAYVRETDTGTVHTGMAAVIPPKPHRFDVNLLDLLTVPEPDGAVELRRLLGLVHQEAERIRAQGFKVQLYLRDGVPRATYYPELVGRFIGAGRWQLRPDPVSEADTEGSL